MHLIHYPPKLSTAKNVYRQKIYPRLSLYGHRTLVTGMPEFVKGIPVQIGRRWFTLKDNKIFQLIIRRGQEKDLGHNAEELSCCQLESNRWFCETKEDAPPKTR